jgi:hypothetical protein
MKYIPIGMAITLMVFGVIFLIKRSVLINKCGNQINKGYSYYYKAMHYQGKLDIKTSDLYIDSAKQCSAKAKEYNRAARRVSFNPLH